MKKEYRHFHESDAYLLALLRIGLGFESAAHCTVHFSAWEQLMEQASLQTVLPIIYDAMMQLPDDQRPSISIVSRMKSETICSILSNERLLSVQDDVLALLWAKAIPSVILKGTSVAVYYPKPELRMQGDIDILVNKADMDRTVHVLESAGYQYSSKKHEFHSAFSKDGASIELHHAVSVFPRNSAGEYIAEMMQTAVSQACFTCLCNHAFPILSDAHQAVSLLLHMQRHMISNGLGLRQLCDWAMFINKLPLSQWQENIHPVLDKCGMLRFAQILTKTCVLHLGLPSNACSWCMHIPNDICFALMCDFLQSGNFGKRDTVRGISSVLLGDCAADLKKKPTAIAFFKNLNKKAEYRLPFIKKIPILLPVMWAFLTVRYFVRMALGRYPRHSLKDISASANQRNLLYSTFHLFETGGK